MNVLRMTWLYAFMTRWCAVINFLLLFFLPVFFFPFLILFIFVIFSIHYLFLLPFAVRLMHITFAQCPLPFLWMCLHPPVYCILPMPSASSVLDGKSKSSTNYYISFIPNFQFQYFPDLLLFFQCILLLQPRFD